MKKDTKDKNVDVLVEIGGPAGENVVHTTTKVGLRSKVINYSTMDATERIAAEVEADKIRENLLRRNRCPLMDLSLYDTVEALEEVIMAFLFGDSSLFFENRTDAFHYAEEYFLREDSDYCPKWFGEHFDKLKNEAKSKTIRLSDEEVLIELQKLPPKWRSMVKKDYRDYPVKTQPESFQNSVAFALAHIDWSKTKLGVDNYLKFVIEASKGKFDDPFSLSFNFTEQ